MSAVGHKKATTQISMYYCSAERITQVFDDDLFGNKERTIKSQAAEVSAEECTRAMRTKETQYGKLEKSQPNEWVVHNAKDVQRLRLKRHEETYTRSKMQRVIGKVIGRNPITRQRFTNSKCVIHHKQCTPKEQKLCILVWRMPRHNVKEFQSSILQKIYHIVN